MRTPCIKPFCHVAPPTRMNGHPYDMMSYSIVKAPSNLFQLIDVPIAKSITGFDYMLTRMEHNPELIMWR